MKIQEEQVNVYVQAVCQGVPETYERYLASNSISETNILRFVSLAYWLSQIKKEEDRKEGFEKFLSALAKDIEDEIEHDGPEVMNLCGLAGAIKENELLIMELSKEIPERLEKGKKAISEIIGRFRHYTPDMLFEKIVGFHPAAVNIFLKH
ncbi:MAG TPA: hypothetical protein P5089_00905 [Candidatus Portnoybacteria bacterium]|nr:hypothetical protein [Candidatus Portnoybacteria bacterium]